MKRSTVARIAAGSALAAVAAGATVAATDVVQQVTQITSGQQSAAPAERGMAAPYRPMRDANVTDEADYLARMVARHHEAVAAARQLQRSQRPQMRALGASIAKTQNAEISTMRAWLDRWYPRRSDTETGYPPMIRDMSRLSGDALDEAFLCDMTDHQMMGVVMSQQLLMSGRARHQEVAAFAVKTRDAERAEVFRMQRDLADRFGGWAVPCEMQG
ncbi:DUF305 domain-containing protein [Nonomuraea sp. NPDC050786]|uniref:DUF305 domain-containing protein n=1 Tax=Nonomuraea sp. NPDC050786 TaxID=3154840 RepID=UPI0033DBFEAF